MNVVPTRATRFLGDRMIREAAAESGADAVLRGLGDCQVDQVPALLGYLLDRCVPQPVEEVPEEVTFEIVVEPRVVPDHAGLVDSVLAEVCATFPVTTTQVRARYGGRQVSEARSVAMWLLRQHGMTYPAIGAQLNRDHSTVMYGVAKVDESERLRGIAVGIQQWTASEGAA